MHLKTDHTGEVEQRIAAIRVYPCDSCSFFIRREGAMVNLRQCIYCAYSVFDRDKGDLQQQGLCKYKK